MVLTRSKSGKDDGQGRWTLCFYFTTGFQDVSLGKLSFL